MTRDLIDVFDEHFASASLSLSEDERNQAIITRLEAGETHIQIARALSVSSRRIAEVAKTHGLQRPRGRPIGGKSQQVRELLAQDEPQAEIARALDVSPQLVSRLAGLIGGMNPA